MATWWQVPRDFAGKTCVILATGESLTQEDVDYAAAHAEVIAISDAWRLCPQAFCLYSCDAKWWMHHQNAPGYRGLKVTLDDSLPFPDVKCLKWRREGEKTYGFDPDPNYLRTGLNSGYQAVHMAVHFGFTRILLLGYDMRGKHFFGDHPKGFKGSSYSEFIAAFRTIVDPLKELGVEVINCTPGSALPWFPMMELREALPCASAA